MSSGCCDPEIPENQTFEGLSLSYRRVLLAVIAINATMFAVEVYGGVLSGSQALMADSLDFLGDTFTYAISLYVLGRSLKTRALAALGKGISLGLMGIWVFSSTAYHFFLPGVPEAQVMSAIGFLALIANVASLMLLLRYRNGDANVRSVWLCSRNDAIGNVAVIGAGGAVALSGSALPDLVVAGVMASLFIWSSTQIIRQALAELRRAKA